MRALTRLYFRNSKWKPNAFPAIDLFASYLTVLLVTWIVVLLRDVFGLPSLVAWAAMVIPLLAVFYVALVAGLILSEKLWKLVGIYRLLNVSGSPIENGFARFGGVVNND